MGVLLFRDKIVIFREVKCDVACIVCFGSVLEYKRHKKDWIEKGDGNIYPFIVRLVRESSRL